MKTIYAAFLISLLSSAVLATEAPPGQTPIGSQQVLRGHFTEQRQKSSDAEMNVTAGHFIAAPAFGLIWGIEQPFPTSTVITANGATQNLGGFVVKLPAKNLHHLYEMIDGALRGDWNRLDTDFVATHNGDAKHWRMLLTPRPDATHPISYSSITVTGGKFLEHIEMVGNEGGTTSFTFTDEVLSPLPLAVPEAALFNENFSQ